MKYVDKSQETFVVDVESNKKPSKYVFSARNVVIAAVSLALFIAALLFFFSSGKRRHSDANIFETEPSTVLPAVSAKSEVAEQTQPVIVDDVDGRIFKLKVMDKDITRLVSFKPDGTDFQNHADLAIDLYSSFNCALLKIPKFVYITDSDKLAVYNVNSKAHEPVSEDNNVRIIQPLMNQEGNMIAYSSGSAIKISHFVNGIWESFESCIPNPDINMLLSPVFSNDNSIFYLSCKTARGVPKDCSIIEFSFISESIKLSLKIGEPISFIVSQDKQRFAYQIDDPLSTIHVRNFKNDEITEFKLGYSVSLLMGWSADGRYIYLAAVSDEFLKLDLESGSIDMINLIDK